jgi:hypothetical protein
MTEVNFFDTPEFCTAWPESLQSDEDCEKHFPIKTSTTDYLHSSPSIRDPLSRIVTLQVALIYFVIGSFTMEFSGEIVKYSFGRKSKGQVFAACQGKIQSN